MRVLEACQRLDGTPGNTLFVKEAGNGTADGWAAK
jgi:hypothetical protein